MVTLMYVEDLARPEVIEEVRTRMKRIDTDVLLDSNYIKEYIQDLKYTLFPLMKQTERPDKVVADLAEGRFGIVVDGSPQILTAPTVFVELLQASEDYYMNPVVSLGLRFLRYFGSFFDLHHAWFVCSDTTFHQEMIPVPLIFGVVGARETVLFPAFFEALLLLLVFELLVEAGIRLPRVGVERLILWGSDFRTGCGTGRSGLPF